MELWTILFLKNVMQKNFAFLQHPKWIHLDSLVVTLLFLLQDVEVQVPKLNGSVVEAAEEVGIVETEAEDEAVATVTAKPRLLVAPDLQRGQQVP